MRVLCLEAMCAIIKNDKILQAGCKESMGELCNESGRIAVIQFETNFKTHAN